MAYMLSSPLFFLKEGDMTSAIALLENIVCRVCYVPGHSDPEGTRRSSEEAHPRLTPNSVNVHERMLQVLLSSFWHSKGRLLEDAIVPNIGIRLRGSQLMKLNLIYASFVGFG